MARSPVLVVTHWDWVLWRYNRAFLSCLADGGDPVAIVCPPGRYTDELSRLGLRHIRWDVTRRSFDPRKEIGAVRQLVDIYRREQPGLVHHVTVKPNIYGSLAARRAGVPRVINTYTGLGYLFGAGLGVRSARRALGPLARHVLRDPRAHSIVLNPSDRDVLVRAGWVAPDRTSLIPSSGVDVEEYHPPRARPRGPFTVLMAARLLRDKGVGTFVDAARILHRSAADVRMILAGEPDLGNPGSISIAEFAAWQRDEFVSCPGHVDDMAGLLRRVHAAALPTTYNEGVPSFLLEAGATGLPLITTDVPGCRLVVEPGKTGLVIPPNDPRALAEAIVALARDPGRAAALGRAARVHVEERFAVAAVVDAYLDLHDRLFAQIPN